MYRLLSLFLFLFPTLLFALDSDRTQALHVTSDSSLYNYKTGITLYEGHVIIDQGTTRIKADRVSTKTDARHKIEEAIAYGFQNLAEYSTLPKVGEAPLYAKAKTIYFYPQKTTIILDNEVTLTQGKNSFQGSRIIYNIKEKIIHAPASKNGRSTLIIEPQQIHS